MSCSRTQHSDPSGARTHSFYDLNVLVDALIKSNTVMILSFWTYRSVQTVKTQIRLLLEEQSDQGFHRLLFHLHVFDKIPSSLASLFEF